MRRHVTQVMLLLCGLGTVAANEVVVEGDVGTACEAVLAGSLSEAERIFRTCIAALDNVPTDDRQTEVRIIREAALAEAMFYLIQDTQAGQMSTDRCRSIAKTVKLLTDADPAIALEELNKIVTEFWEDAETAISLPDQRRVLEYGESLGEAFCRRKQAREELVRLGVLGPHPSILFVVQHTLATLSLTGTHTEVDPCVPDLDQEYLKSHGMASDQVDRERILEFALIEDAIVDLKRAPSISAKIYRGNREVGIPPGFSPRFYCFSDAYDKLYSARTEYKASTRCKALCYALGLEAGQGMLREWRLDYVIFAANRFADRDEFRKVISEDRKALGNMEIKTSGAVAGGGAAGFGTGFVHGFACLFLLFAPEMEFAYPGGVGAWPVDYILGVILGGILFVIMVGRILKAIRADQGQKTLLP